MGSKMLLSKYKYIFLGSSLLIIISLSLWAWWWQQPIAVDLELGQCEINYGEEVASWRGDSEESWNEEGVAYVARSFSLNSQSESVRRPNAYYSQPHYISSGGDLVCDDDFDNLIDLVDEDYTWYGARTHKIRIGLPDVEFDGELSAFSNLEDAAHADSSLATPLHDRYGTPPAVWTDDGGSASIVDGETEKSIWCVNTPDCEDYQETDDDNESLRGRGYQYVSDNCPSAIRCDEGWYQGSTDLDISVDEYGLIEPFRLNLYAYGTHPPIVGTEVVMVFAYNVDPILSMSIAAGDAQQLTSGSVLGMELELRSIGPHIADARVDFDLDGQPLTTEFSSKVLDSEQVQQLSKGGLLSIAAELQINETTTAGQCHELPISFHVETVEGLGSSVQSTSLHYCIAEEREVYTYSIATRGDTVADMNEFASRAAATLMDSRGWSRAGISFREVEGGGDFTLWLAAPDQMTSFSTLCSPDYSCRVGRDVIVNDVRWREATVPWNEAGGSIRDYQHMVVNHEVGHLIGFGHYGCPSPGSPAPVMQQQSIDLAGCTINPWPLEMEIEAYSNL